MIEFPEAVVLSQEINDAVSGKTIHNVITAQSPHKLAWYHKDPEAYDELLVNSTIQQSYNQGGFVRIDLNDEKTILLSEGVRIRYIHEGEQLPQKHQLLIEFSDHSNLACSVQMYGGLVAFKNQEYDNVYYAAAREKPLPLSNAFDVSYFNSLITSSSEKLSLKAFLATEQRIPGIGNGVLQDILFNAELHPKRKINSLSQANKKSLYNSIKSTLLKMTKEGGRDTERDIFGYPGGYQTQLCKNTVGKPCRNCGTLIQKQAYMGGSIYFCGGCQKM